jgi:antitoxin component of MazEF toxin-antitoxin module
MLKRKIRRVGYSLVVTIPSQLADAYDIKEGDTMEMEFTGSKILMRVLRDDA